MASSSQGYHERDELLSERTQDLHRAIVSLQEELEAVDWYQQRIDATRDRELREILVHNRDEEKEHAVMVMEWIRRRDVKFDALMRELLFKEGPIQGQHAGPGAQATPTAPRLTVGRLTGEGAPK